MLQSRRYNHVDEVPLVALPVYGDPERTVGTTPRPLRDVTDQLGMRGLFAPADLEDSLIVDENTVPMVDPPGRRLVLLSAEVLVLSAVAGLVAGALGTLIALV